MKLTESDLNRVIRQSVKKVVNEMYDEQPTIYDRYYENINCYDVLNDNFDGNWSEILNAKLYNGANNYVGKLKDLHFIYNVEEDKFEGSNNW